ncbi:tryptophan synthase beta subunit-like PLP-dependent enzyme [Cantharellus anzutake]|uniref:tryptophan synthase beta subunit-like PLP-dependent enzyme n=1 Tax=Cantharellus anzutake TaxID=1750568 RepID=UPI001906DD95|nr:tryptophan synthase beta subunit-like PLP-dependent enzyme [Cantharellus anzutake]KAF8326357.1 tryptophan synthase beta subunit-like PLP-dependent enzyme [Cantharellus anzutake]
MWTKTPLLYSESISSRLGCNVFLKLETLQPTLNFKQRSQTKFAKQQFEKHGSSLHLVMASGGNAAFALAYAAHTLGVKCTVFIPREAGKKIALDALRRWGTETIVDGDCYQDALSRAHEFASKHENAVMGSPYEYPVLWEGVSTMVDEIAEQLPSDASPPAAILCSVGGGSLLGGMLLGCNRHGWENTRIIAVETQGAESTYSSIMAAEGSPDSLGWDRNIQTHVDEETGVTVATLAKVTTRATSLGSVITAPGVLKMALDRRAKGKGKYEGGLTTVSIPDELAMLSGLSFLDEHKIMVELASSATLSPIYSPQLFREIFGVSTTANRLEEKPKTLVFIVCGGFKITASEMETYRKELEAGGVDGKLAFVDGMRVDL